MSVLPLKEKKAPGYILGLCLCLYATDPAHLAIIKDLSVCSFRHRRLASIECLHFVTRFLKLRLSLFQVRRIEVQHSVHRVFLARVRESSDGNKTSWNMLEQVGTKPDHWSKNQSEPRTAPMPHGLWRGGPLIWWTQKGQGPAYVYLLKMWLCMAMLVYQRVFLPGKASYLVVPSFLPCAN